jgi:hypothetical protein
MLETENRKVSWEGRISRKGLPDALDRLTYPSKTIVRPVVRTQSYPVFGPESPNPLILKDCAVARSLT